MIDMEVGLLLLVMTGNSVMIPCPVCMQHGSCLYRPFPAVCLKTCEQRDADGYDGESVVLHRFFYILESDLFAFSFCYPMIVQLIDFRCDLQGGGNAGDSFVEIFLYLKEGTANFRFFEESRHEMETVVRMAEYAVGKMVVSHPKSGQLWVI